MRDWLTMMVLGVAAFWGLSACSEDPAGAPPGPGADASQSLDAVVAPADGVGPETSIPGEGDSVQVQPAVTYHGHIRPLMDRECLGCHTGETSISFSMAYDSATWVDSPPAWAPMASSAVAAGRMPPWTPDLSCRDVSGERALTHEEIELFATWTDLGYPEGDPESYPGAPEGTVQDWGPPARVLGPAGVYTPDPSAPDDHRCFVLEGEFEQDAYVIGDEILPGELGVVHHVITYVVTDPGGIAQALALTSETPELGYPCFGGTEVGGDLIGGWVPGMQPVQTPPGSARKIPAGSRLVMQVHYNTVYADPEVVPADHTRVALWTLPEGEVPEQLVRFEAFANHEIHVPAGLVGVTQVQVDILGFTGTVIGAVPHMHTFGRSIKAQVIRSGESECLMDIPEWDFNWQQMYQFPSSEWVQVSPGDAHRLTCIYDNDQAAQPWIGGEQGEPADLTWGDGTFDEMCLNFLMVMSPAAEEPVVPEPPPEPDSCTSIMDCYGECPEGEPLCFLNCLGEAAEPCVDCGVDAIVACSQETCGPQLNTIKACLDQCVDGVVLCAAGPCYSEYEALYACSEPLLLSGLCDAFFEPCEDISLEP